MSLHYLVKNLCSNRHAQGGSGVKCRVRLSHSKNGCKIFVCWNKQYLVTQQKDVHISHIKNHMTHCIQLLQQRKRCSSKMLYMISSWSVADGVSLSVNKSKLVYRSLISVENKVKWIWYNPTHTHTHTRIMASGFYWSKRQWVAVASAGPYASLHLAPDR